MRVMATVRVALPTVSRSPRRSPRTRRGLGFAIGDEVTVIIKATEVMLAKD